MSVSELVPPAAPTVERWCRAAGLTELGSAQGSGLRAPRFLLQRADGQVVQLSALLHLIVREVSADRDAAQVATAVSRSYERDLSADGLRHLITTKLAPLGLVQPVEQAGVALDSAPADDPLLSLRLRRTLIGARGVRGLANGLSVLFRPALILLALAAVVGLDVALFARGSVLDALDLVFATPTFLLALVGIITLCSLVHELGHAAACHYGGARPGVIGVGVYLVFPAFFTNVTDSYRLDRIGRIRTDLGGLYFNVWCLIGLDTLFLFTHNGLLLLASLLLHIEMIQQLIPTVRFDGYFVLADVAGVPDLFARVGPVLLSLLPGRAADPRVTELKPAARRIVTGWVVLVVPTLVAGFAWMAYSSPYLIRHTIAGLRAQWMLLHLGWTAGPAENWPAILLAAFSMALLVLPMLGLVILIQRTTVLVGRGGLALVRRRRTGGAPASDLTAPLALPSARPMIEPTRVASLADRHGHDTDQLADAFNPLTEPVSVRAIAIREGLSAAVFTDDEMMLGRGGGPAPEGGWRRAVFSVSAGAVNPGPSAAHRRRAELLARVTAPISGARRVVVMSRKGGVGKTTTTLALGGMFAQLRGDRVIAVDANPDAGNLAHRVARPGMRSITDVLREIEAIDSYSALREYTTCSADTRLEVLASDDDPRIGMALNRKAYHDVIDLLDRYYNLILLDTGTGILDSANQGLLTEADQLVLVLRPALDGARAAALTLDWLSEHGYGELVASAVVVLNASRGRSRVSIDKVTDHFARRCSTVVTVPWDPALEAGAQTDLTALRTETRDALIGLAAAVADQFAAGRSPRGLDRPFREELIP